MTGATEAETRTGSSAHTDAGILLIPLVASRADIDAAPVSLGTVVAAMAGDAHRLVEILVEAVLAVLAVIDLVGATAHVCPLARWVSTVDARKLRGTTFIGLEPKVGL